jgi:hypothetical protein
MITQFERARNFIYSGNSLPVPYIKRRMYRIFRKTCNIFNVQYICNFLWNRNKGRVIFKKYIPEKHKYFGIQIYKLCDMTGYKYDMRIYLGKDRRNAMQMMTATHVLVKSLTRRVEGTGHKLYTSSFFSYPDLSDELHTRGIKCCGTARQNH